MHEVQQIRTRVIKMSMWKLNEFEEKLIDSIDNLTEAVKENNRILKKGK